MNYFFRQWWKKRNTVFKIWLIVLIGLVILINNYNWSSKLFEAIKSFVGPDPWKYVMLILIPAVIRAFIWYAKKTYDINKLKSWKVPTREITAQVTAIEYVKGGKNNNGAIVGRTFTAEGTNPINNEPYTFQSEEYPYSNTKWRLRLFWPTQEDKEEFNVYVAQYIKIWDPIKVFVSIEDADDYYLQDLTHSAKNISDSTTPVVLSTRLDSIKDVSVLNVLKLLWISLLVLWIWIASFFLYTSSPESGLSTYVIIWPIIIVILIILGITSVITSKKKQDEDPSSTHGV